MAEREILFPENHILSPPLGLSGICAKTESFSDGYHHIFSGLDFTVTAETT